MTSQEPTQKILSAAFFAAQKHTDQRRKGERAEPYINHLAEVAEMLAKCTAGQDADVVAAGFLHDTIEDTDTTYEDLKREFGENIADIVKECTDDKSLTYEERKRLQIEHATHISPQAKMVKIADKISNLRSLLASPPVDWDDARKAEYIEWSKKVVDNCRGVNTCLEQEFDATYQRGIRKFKKAA